jgi:hypothetical protein
MLSMYFWRDLWEIPYYCRFYGHERVPLRDLLGNLPANHHLTCGKLLRPSDLKDFIYSSFGMISDLEEFGLHVDYSKSVEEVYTELAEAVVRSGKIYWLSTC